MKKITRSTVFVTILCISAFPAIYLIGKLLKNLAENGQQLP